MSRSKYILRGAIRATGWAAGRGVLNDEQSKSDIINPVSIQLNTNASTVGSVMAKVTNPKMRRP